MIGDGFFILLVKIVNVIRTEKCTFEYVNDLEGNMGFIEFFKTFFERTSQVFAQLHSLVLLNI